MVTVVQKKKKFHSHSRTDIRFNRKGHKVHKYLHVPETNSTAQMKS